jgi:P4 family phage/plasmid primase-like protien
MAFHDDDFADLVIPSIEEMDASTGLRCVKKSSDAVKTAAPISPTLPEMCSRYDALGLRWEKTPLVWNPGKTDRNGNVGAKDGIRQHQGREHPDWNGYLLSMEGLLVIDVDGDCETCAWVDSILSPAATAVAKTRKGHHYLFNAHPRLRSQNAKKGEPEIDTKTGKGAVLLCEPSFYIHPTEGKIEYKWLKFPETRDGFCDVPDEVVDWLTSHGYGTEAPPRPSAVIAAPPTQSAGSEPSNKLEGPTRDTISLVSPDDEEELPASLTAPAPVQLSVMEQVEKLCDCLTVEWLSEFNNWLRLLYCLKNISASVEMRELFLKHSARVPAYNSPAHVAQNRKMWDATKVEGRSGMGSLKHFAKKCNPEKYFSDAKGNYWALVQANNANGYCELFYNAMAGDILWSNSRKCFYVYDERETLWKASENNAYINFLFVEMTSAIFRKMLAEIPPAMTEADAEARKSKQKLLAGAAKSCGGQFVITMVQNFLPAFCRGDDDPAAYMDQNPDLLPLANGVWKFSDKKLIKYERDHFFTFRIPINYNPSADKSLIERAALDWFGHDAEVADFLKYWIGYCLTGHTTRQEFLVAWGTKAGNGKSLLWGTILSTLLGPYYHTITSDALSTERTGNNDQLYNLNGKRFAFLSEPRRSSRAKLDNEIVKTLTGDKYFTAEAKYKNAITFRLQAKFVMACNDLPDIKFEDAGTYRRVKVCEQNICFLDPDDFEKADARAKAEHRIKMKDDAFIGALLENTEGLMLWALQGASSFIDDPRRNAPGPMNSAKEKAVSDLDIVGNWIGSNIQNLKTADAGKRPTDWEKRKITMKQLKDMLRIQGVNLGQNVPGFERTFRSKLEGLGYECGGREGKGDFYIRYAMEVEEEAGGEVLEM